ncbi:hypothetical protein [Salipiger abyssi]|uniref:hypothetical protein n=1 Tax=Salipiger abyssi TaxID=1250539 RepID=UPI001A8FB8BD|nr:hypothetical protein [Salipiger abyssi]MBN9887699.1 hypothetical protein [Salipiger abyssi]
MNGKPKVTQIVASYSLPRKYLGFEILGSGSTMNSSSVLAVQQKANSAILMPDPNPGFRYEVNYVPSRFSNDTVDINVANQLLGQITVNTDDQSGQALIDLAQALGHIGRLRGTGILGTPGASGRAETATTVVSTLRLDPTDPQSVARAQRLLGRRMDLSVSPAPRAVGVIHACNHTFCYRPLTTATISFRDRTSGNVTEFVVQVPDPHQISGVDIERSSFVKRDTIITFSDGQPQSINVKKPSELAAAALLPLAVVTAVFTGVNDATKALLGLRKNELTASTELLKAQTAFLTALAEYRSTYDSAQAEAEGVSADPDLSGFTTVGGRTGADGTDEEDDSPGLGAREEG